MKRKYTRYEQLVIQVATVLHEKRAKDIRAISVLPDDLYDFRKSAGLMSAKQVSMSLGYMGIPNNVRAALSELASVGAVDAFISSESANGRPSFLYKIAGHIPTQQDFMGEY